MLQLRHDNWEISQLLPPEQTRYDNHYLRLSNNNAVINRRHVTSKDIASTLLPFYTKGIKFKTLFAEINTDEENLDDYDAVLQSILEEFANNTYWTEDNEDCIFINRIYTRDIDAVKERMIDTFKPVPESIQSIYNKVSSDTYDREGYLVATIAYYDLESHTILLVSNYDDYLQASDMYLTIGLLPVLFPHIKEKLDTDEIDYCKAFVRRAQIKRITNTFITEAFRKATSESKFKDILDDLKYKKIVEDISYAYTQNLENQISQSSRQVSDYLQAYESAYNTYLRLQKQLEERAKDKSRVMDEVKIALKTEGVVNFKLINNRSILEIWLRVPCMFYEQDEAELVIRRLNDSTAKRFLTDVFVDNKYKLHITNRLTFRLTQDDPNNPARLQKPGEVPLDIMQRYNGLFNPHTHFYACIGDYEPELVRAQANGDLLAFINLMIASTKSINFRDGAVINRFISCLDSVGQSQPNDFMYYQLSNVKCLEAEDGQLYTIRELYVDGINSEVTEVELTDTLYEDNEDDDWDEEDEL